VSVSVENVRIGGPAVVASRRQSLLGPDVGLQWRGQENKVSLFSQAFHHVIWPAANPVLSFFRSFRSNTIPKVFAHLASEL
jgi:hypothetical protein